MLKRQDKYNTEYKFGRLVYVSNKKLLHILVRGILSDPAMRSFSKRLRETIFKLHIMGDQAFNL